MKTTISSNQKDFSLISQTEVNSNNQKNIEASLSFSQDSWTKSDIILLREYLYPLILLDKGEWLNQPRKGLIRSIFTKVGQQVFICLYNRKASFHLELMADTGLGKSSIN